jgi:hypothetical protein
MIKRMDATTGIKITPPHVFTWKASVLDANLRRPLQAFRGSVQKTVLTNWLVDRFGSQLATPKTVCQRKVPKPTHGTRMHTN